MLKQKNEKQSPDKDEQFPVDPVPVGIGADGVGQPDRGPKAR